MKKIIIYGLITILSGISPLFAGGQPEGAEVSSPSDNLVEKTADDFTPITITDVLGREVTINKPVRSIAYSHYGTADALKILDVWDIVVARDGYSNDKSVFTNLDEIPPLSPPMGSPYEPNMELLYELNPDLFILEVIPMPGLEDLIKTLSGTISVVAIKTYNPDEIANSLNLLGSLLGKEKEAAEYVAWYNNLEKSISDKTKNLKEEEKIRLFYKAGYGNVEDLMTFSNALSYIPARNRITGCINIAADLPSQGGWVPSLDSEWLVSQDFDVLLIGDPLQGVYGSSLSDFSALKKYREDVMALSVFKETSAVKNDRVYMIGDGFFGTPRFIIGFAFMAKWFHPELFTDFDPAQLNQEYFTRFLRTDMDVINNGVFVYTGE